MQFQSLAVGCGAAILFASPLEATILTFDQDPPIGNFEAVNQSYGDRVTTTSAPGNYQYGVGPEGFTPNVVASYLPSEAVPALWSTGYGNLTNILFKDADGFPTLQVVLTADPGFLTQLYEFDMAAFSSAFSSDPAINYIRVLDSEGNELFRQNNAVISETTHTTFDFSAALLTDDVIVIEFDSINLGGLSDDIALDNIRFGETVVPEPAGLSVLAVSAVGLRRRRR